MTQNRRFISILQCGETIELILIFHRVQFFQLLSSFHPPGTFSKLIELLDFISLLLNFYLSSLLSLFHSPHPPPPRPPPSFFFLLSSLFLLFSFTSIDFFSPASPVRLYPLYDGVSTHKFSSLIFRIVTEWWYRTKHVHVDYEYADESKSSVCF